MEYDIDLIDICAPDYLLDHCNGEGEYLLAVTVGRNTRVHSVRAALIDEWNGLDPKHGDDGEEADFSAAIANAFRGQHPLARFGNVEDNDGEVYAYFRLTFTD